MNLPVKKRRKLLAFIGVFAFFAVLIFAFEQYSAFEQYKTNRAIECAKEYLSEKYEQEMEYISIVRNRATDWSYSLRFSPCDNSDLRFQVRLASNLKPEVREDGINTYPSDGYLTARFSYNARQEILKMIPVVTTIDNVRVGSGGSIYAINSLREDMSQQEMAELLTYELDLSIGELSAENKDVVAQEIVALLQAVSRSYYDPDMVYLFVDSNSVSDKKVFILNEWEQFDSATKLLTKLGA